MEIINGKLVVILAAGTDYQIYDRLNSASRMVVGHDGDVTQFLARSGSERLRLQVSYML